MKKMFGITIKETLVKDVYVYAENEEDANEKVDNLYSSGLVVLDYNDFLDRELINSFEVCEGDKYYESDKESAEETERLLKELGEVMK